MANLRRGSSGSDVKELQELLNKNGYGLSTDGIYGNKTEAAVRDYQKKNNLSVDGIAGNNTLGALRGTNPNTANTANSTVATTTKPTAPTIPATAKPTYKSTYNEQIRSIIDKINSGEKFNYDFNADPLYQQYKERYMAQGKTAMEDTTARLAALSGGYGNSYAATAGNQAYQSYLDGLNDIIPELYDRAYNKYANERSEDYNRLSALQGAEDSDYNKFLNELSQWNADRDYDYNKFLGELSQWNADRDYAFNKEQADIANAQWEKQYALSKASASRSSSGGSGGGKGGEVKKSKYDTVFNKAKDMEWEQAKAYIELAVQNGDISGDDGMHIFDTLFINPQLNELKDYATKINNLIGR